MDRLLEQLVSVALQVADGVGRGAHLQAVEGRLLGEAVVGVRDEVLAAAGGAAAAGDLHRDAGHHQRARHYS